MKLVLMALCVLLWGTTVLAQPSGNLGQITPIPNTSSQPYGYNEYLPLHYNPNQTYPLVVHLHGIGEPGPGTVASLQSLINGSPLRRVQDILNNPNSSTGRHYPAIVVTPQSGTKWFSIAGVKNFIDYLIQVGYPVDQDRIYIMGLSAGGGATWRFAQEYPDLPAAIVPVCGASYVKDPSIELQEIPVWAFHNFQDGTVGRTFTMKNGDYISSTGGPSINSKGYLYPYVQPNNQMATTHQTFQYDGNTWSIASGVNAPTRRLAVTIYSSTGHNAWTRTYNNDDMWTWLFAQSRTNTNPITVNAGTDITVNASQQPQLVGSATTSNGTITRYQWVKLKGPKDEISSTPTQSSTTLSNLTVGTYVFRLSAKNSDNRVGYHDVQVHVTAAPSNTAPIAHAGADASITLPTNSAYLDGSASADPDGSIVSYQWSMVSGPTSVAPAGNPIWINFCADSSRGIAPAPWNNTMDKWRAGDVVTNIVDNQNNPTTITLEILDTWGGMHPPGPVTGDDSGVMPDVVMSTTQWFRNGMRSIRVSGLQANGGYDFTFHGGRAGNGNRQTIYTIGSQSGMLNASNNTTQVVTLQGVMADAQGELVIEITKDSAASYAYLNGMIITPLSGNPVTIDQPTSATTNVYNLQQGTYVFELAVTDNDGATHSDQVQIMVLPMVANRNATSGSAMTALAQEATFSVYPNPTSSVVMVEGQWEGVERVQIVDLMGRVQAQVEQPQGKVQFRVTDWQAGVYFIQINKANQTPITYQLVIQ